MASHALALSPRIHPLAASPCLSLAPVTCICATGSEATCHFARGALVGWMRPIHAFRSGAGNPQQWCLGPHQGVPPRLLPWVGKAR